jgi:hypothetical protein
MAKLTETGWELIVHVDVDENDTGTNENGFGDGMDCTMFNGNFNAWSLACFKSKLYVGIQSLGGTRVLYTPNGSSEDGNWFYSAGGNSLLPNGFDGEINEGASSHLGETVYQNIAVNIFPFGDYLYAGLTCIYMPEYGATEEYLAGSQMWKTSDGINWNQITDDGFGDPSVLNFEAFAGFNGTLYVAASRAANTVGGGLGGATIFRLASGPLDDYDLDGFKNSEDNCPLIANAGQEDGDNDGTGNVCDNCPATANPAQEDSYPPQGNAIGDACDCEGNFNCDADQDVDGSDASLFKADFGRSNMVHPCIAEDTCNGDFNCDGDVDGTDASLFKSDFGRSSLQNPCPACISGGAWCQYQ